MSKLLNVPIEPKTNIISMMEDHFGEYEVIYEKRKRRGKHKESLIFPSQEMSELDDLQLKDLVRGSSLVQNDSEITIKRADGYVFVNFNFH